MTSRSLSFALLLGAITLPLAGCIVEPYHHHEYRPAPVYAAPPPPPGYVVRPPGY